MYTFRIGDYVTLKPSSQYFSTSFTIFRIDNISEAGYTLILAGKNIPYDDILPLEINDEFKKDYGLRIEDHDYAPLLELREPFKAPMEMSNDSLYYYESDKLILDNKTIKQIVKEKNLKYVHELQHLLHDINSVNFGYKRFELKSKFL